MTSRHFPNVWGEGGALFAFSGMDGETDSIHPLVGSTLDEGRGLIFHTKGTPILRFGVRFGESESLGTEDAPFDDVTDDVVAGSLTVSRIVAGGSAFRLEFLFLDKDTVGIRVVCEQAGQPVEVFIECMLDGDSSLDDGVLLQSAGSDHYALVCSDVTTRVDNIDGRMLVRVADGQCVRFVWAHSPVDASLARAKASNGLDAGFDAAAGRELRYLRSLSEPDTSDPGLARTFYKCASVMKVNCCSAQGDIPFPWTTPDRWPHRHMWIWDSAFHAIGLRHISPQWAEDAIKSVLAAQREDGFIPHTITIDRDRDSSLIQPPILAWAAMKVYATTNNLNFLTWVYPRLAKMLQYDCEVMDADSDGLSEWGHRFASGMDNSPRFDQPVGGAVDLNCFIVQDMQCLGLMARALGRSGEAQAWDRLAGERAQRINDRLWDNYTQFYYDKTPDGGLVHIKTVAGFAPLVAGVCDAGRAKALVHHMTNPSEFWREFPVASVSADETSFSDNMWRGPTWINYNYMLVEGLRRYGFDSIADDLSEKTIREIARWYALDGLVYEYYDSEGVTDPVLLHRKERGGPQANRSTTSLGTTVRDFNWTAALYIDLLLRKPLAATTGGFR